MQNEVREILRIRSKLAVLEFAQGIGGVMKAWQIFEVPRSTFYDWKKGFDKEGKAGLARRAPQIFLAFFDVSYPHANAEAILDRTSSKWMQCAINLEVACEMRTTITIARVDRRSAVI
jgi:hypothetical protein